MERVIIFLLFTSSLLFSCHRSKSKEISQYEKLDTHHFSSEDYQRNVKQFLDSLKVSYQSELTVIFANSNTCNTCTFGVLNEMLPSIKNTSVKTIIFLDDHEIEKFLARNIHNKLIEVIYFDTDIYESFHIFHSQPTIYHFINNELVYSE